MPPSRSKKQLERDLQLARDQGRWLSEDEHLEFEKREQLRTKLLVLTGVCILLPPFWPFAFGLILYLLFPRSISRIGIAAIAAMVVGGLLMMALFILIIINLVNVLIR
ncbi:hypothetical protein [Synechococcus sp. M16CYN]|uniref:hypothetical protein n=1 Tax=Synechococcus sp. M16CYN TaxID=3103139 RepID=UPI00324C0D85